MTLLSLLFLSGVTTSVSASESVSPPPLHQRIDQLIAEGNVAAVAPRIGDAEFVRRIYLDLTGSIPTVEQARAFLADVNPAKRSQLIDRLLASRENVAHLASTFDVWLMERRGESHVKSSEWLGFLSESFAANKSYLELVREILAADGTPENNRAAARFYLDRLGDPNLISRDVGRIFFGQDMQCAQCHDHPQITDYLQRDYYGMFAFFGRTYLFQPDKKKPAVLGEKALGGGDFKSVFTEVEGAELPRLPHGRTSYADPEFEPGEEYSVKPDPKNKNLLPIPKHSRRAQIAAALGEEKNSAFNRNIANRLWAQMMGKGLVVPFDFHHASNPPSHPELLQLLADEFESMNYDVRAFLRELALTETYQRSFEMPAELSRQAEKVRPTLAELRADEGRLAEISRAAAGALDEAKAAWNAARIAAIPHENALAAAEQKRLAAQTASSKADEALAEAKAEVDKITATTVEGKTNPKLPKLEADIVAKQKAVDAAKTALATAAAETEKWRQPADAERVKVTAATEKLEAALESYQIAKPAWKLAQRKLDDAEALIAYSGTLAESKGSPDQAEQDAAKLAALEERVAATGQIAELLRKSAESAQAARAQFPDDVDLVNAASVLGDRSRAADVAHQTASDALSTKKAEMTAAIEKSADTGKGELSERATASFDELSERWSDAFATGAFTQLTPEQLCHSMLRATGQWDKLAIAGEAAFDKKLADQAAAAKKQQAADSKKESKSDDKKAEPVLTEAERRKFVEDYVDTQVSATTKRFVQLFGGQPGLPQNDFFATADQALYLSNDGTVRSWLRPSGGNLTGRLLAIEDPADLARELYLSVLTRAPDATETAAIRDFLAAHPEQKSVAVQDLSWALLSSVEFRFKH